MFHKKLLTILMAGTLASTAFANNADEYIYCHFRGHGSTQFNLSKRANAKEVNSDFGSTTEYGLNSHGNIIWAEGNSSCDDLGFSDCTDEDTRWYLRDQGNGKWAIKGRFRDSNFPLLSTINDATCISSPDNPHKRAAW